MTLGGGIFTDYNKTFPGAYVNTITRGPNVSLYGERGYVAAPMALSWGDNTKSIVVAATEFTERARELFGYDPKAPELRNVRELLKGAKTAIIPRLDKGGVKAANAYFTAAHAGTRGNALKTVIQPNVLSTETETFYDVLTYLDTRLVARQNGVRTGAELVANAYAVPKENAELQVTAGTPFTNGTNGTVTAESHQEALNRLDSAFFNVLVCSAADPDVKAMYEEHTIVKNDNQGVKFQTVVHRYAVDNKYIISVENNDTPELVYWVGGRSSGVSIGQSLTNAPYNGEYTVSFSASGVDYDADDYKRFIKEGRFAFYSDNETPTIVMDINTKTTVTAEENEWFKDNQTVRISQQSAQDKARIFNNLFLGKVPNDDEGRLSLWNEITKYNKDFLQDTYRAITNYLANDTEVYYISKKQVGIEENLELVNAMEQLFIVTVFI